MKNNAMDSENLFEYFWNIPEEWIEVPNARRRGTSGVIRCETANGVMYVKKQVNHLHWNLRYPFGRPTALREVEALEAMKRLEICVPDVVFQGARKINGEWQTLLVTKELEGFIPLDDIDSWRPTLKEADHLEIIRRTAETLARLHANRWQHSSLYGKHIMVARKKSGFRVALIDLEKMRRRLTVKLASEHDLDQLCRRQKCWNESHWNHFLNEYRILMDFFRKKF